MPGSTAPPAAVPPPDSFAEEVRAALDHLYDHAFLYNHPLTGRLCANVASDTSGGVTRTQRVRTVLLDAIEQLRPIPRAVSRTGGASGSAAANDEMRAYAILTFRCMDGLSMDEIAAKLGLSRRQAYREYAKGVEAVAGLVWDTLPPGEPVPQGRAGDPTRRSAAAEEVARLTADMLLEPVDLGTVACEVADLLAPRVRQTGAALHVVRCAPLPDDLPDLLPERVDARALNTAAGSMPPVMADRALLRQALLNLFSYALDQACGGGEVVVTCTGDGRAAALRLIACRENVATAVPREPARREGVGVTIAQTLVAAMGGQAQIERAGDKWRCALLLPAAQRATILVVDDNADLTALFQRYAAGYNLSVVGATNGLQALELAMELRPQLIILDLMLSHMDGWEILQRLRRSADTASTPIVICSVLNEPDLAFSMGASDYVTKPISQSTLVDVLQRWLGTLPPAV